MTADTIVQQDVMDKRVTEARKILDTCITQGLNRYEMAKEIGISQTAFSQFLAMKYLGNNQNVADKIFKWDEQREKRDEVASILPEKIGFVMTETSARINAALAFAQHAKDLVIIYGGAGLSKTSTIRQYEEMSQNVWIVEADPSISSLGGFLRSVAGVLGVRIPRGHHDYLTKNLIERLRMTSGLLVVDEAQFLNQRSLESARRICELAGIGLALSGNESIYAQFTGGKRSAEFAQLFSRIGKRVHLNRPTEKDVEMIGEAWKLGKEEIEFAKQIAAKNGGLRMLDKTLRLATMFSKGERLNLTVIKSAYKDLTKEA